MTAARTRCPVALVLSGERGRVGRVGESRILAFQAQHACLPLHRDGAVRVVQAFSEGYSRGADVFEVICVFRGGRYARWACRGRACGIEDTSNGWRTANFINKTRRSVKKGCTVQIFVGLFELIPSLGRLLIDPVVDGRDGHAVVLCVDKICDTAYILFEKQS